jgi:MFS family permease
MMIHIVPHSIDLGLRPGDAAKVLSTLGAFSIAGRFLMGAAGDRVGNIKAMFVCFIFLFTGLMWLQFSNNIWMLIIFAMIHGFAHGGVFSVISHSCGAVWDCITWHYFRDYAFISSIGGFIGPVWRVISLTGQGVTVQHLLSCSNEFHRELITSLP